jgi:glycine C-acetyltransferase
VVTAGVLKSLELAQKEPQLRTQLWANVAHIRAKLDEAGVDIGQSTSQVIPIMVKNDRRVFELGHKLLRAGLYLQPIIYPAVAKHRSRFRVSISATHTIDQLDEGVAILVKVLREEGILV